MTKLWVLSDLHQDHGTFSLDVPDAAEIAVVAGDVVNDEFLIELAEKIPVVFVAGNHEFYRHGVAERKASLAGLPIHFLDDAAVSLMRVRFVGATLWTDYDGGNRFAMDAARRGMNDHRLIKWQKEPWKRFRPEEARQLHQRSRAFLYESLLSGGARPTVVVTHHAPSPLSIHKKYAGAIINHAYFTDLSELILLAQPRLWIHGHTHSSFDYHIGETRVLCNPHGYPGENNAFDPRLIVEVGND